MVANLLKKEGWDDANEASFAHWPKTEKAHGPVSILDLKTRKDAAHIWNASAISNRKVHEIIYDHRIEDLEKRLKKMENQIAELTSIDYEEPDKIVLKDISYGRAKKEIREYFSKHHGENIDAADIQEALNIDISLALGILDDLEDEGKIKAG